MTVQIIKKKKKRKGKGKVIQKYGRWAETQVLSIILSKNQADQTIPDVLMKIVLYQE